MFVGMNVCDYVGIHEHRLKHVCTMCITHPCLYMPIMMESGFLCALSIQSSVFMDVQICVSMCSRLCHVGMQCVLVRCSCTRV